MESHSAVAKSLGIPRSTFLRYFKAGCPDTAQEAREWIAEHFPDRVKESSAVSYSSKPVNDTDSQSRFQRLKESEIYLASQIRGIQEKTLPELVSQLVDADEKSKPAIDRKLGQANKDLLVYRKEHTKISKVISDIELKRLSGNKDMVPRAWVHDELVRVFMALVVKCNDLSMHKPEEEKRIIDDSRNQLMGWFIEMSTNLSNVLLGVCPIGYESGNV